MICFVSGAGLLAQDQASGEKIAITHGPYLQQPTENSIMVLWFTNVNCVSSVEYGTGENLKTFPQWGSIPVSVRSSRHGLVEANTRFHKVMLTNLEPGKTYLYRVVSKEIKQFKPYEVIYGDSVVSEVYRFKKLEPGKKEFSFCVFQDIHENAGRLDTMLQSIFWENIDLVFYNGDTLDYFETEADIFDGFLDVSVQRFAKEIPLILVRGNHETRGKMARNLMDYFPTNSGRFYYSFNHGPVHFVILDSGEDKPDSHPVYAGLADFDEYRKKQGEWLKKDLQSKASLNAAFNVAVFHMPLVNRKRHGIQQIVKYWSPVLNQAKTDLVLCGHMHRFSVSQPEPGKRTFPLIIAPPDAVTLADVTDKQISLTIKTAEGKILASFSVMRKTK
jgi:predicted phosphodiesterase